MPKPYNAFDWYWLSDNGQIYGSARQAKVQKGDVAYSAWMEDGTLPTPWPTDESGSQTDAALQDVLTPYGLSVSGATSTAVPMSVTSSQAKIQLFRTPGKEDGKTLLDDVTAAVTAASGEVAIWYTEARTWDRNNPYVATLSKGLGLSSSEVDDLFIAAAKIAA